MDLRDSLVTASALDLVSAPRCKVATVAVWSMCIMAKCIQREYIAHMRPDDLRSVSAVTCITLV
jgi:hypothetical protein